MKIVRVKEILEKIKTVKVGVYGDFCIDAYWILNTQGGEISVETGLKAQAVGKHYYRLGGASNLVANLAALEPAQIRVIGVIGEDIFGRELLRQFKELGVDFSGLVVQEEDFDTYTFGKRYLRDEEQSRIDFGFFNQRTEQTDDTLLKSMEQALEQCDVLIFNQQVPGSITNRRFIERANGLFEKYKDKIVLCDSRHYGDKLKNIYRKTNDIEAAKLNGVEVDNDDVITLGDIKSYAAGFYTQFNKPAFVTRGARGIIAADGEGVREVPGLQIIKKIDSVGAGDTTTSALALSLAAGVSAGEAAAFANFAAAVTVQKLFQTGTASGEEILQVSKDPDYIYQPELAVDIRQAQYIPETEIEICCAENQFLPGKIKHAIFDHDGTISTLRQGWEAVMESVMVKAILEKMYYTADETLYHKVVKRVRDYIDNSTGIQTIVQMEALVEMVNEFGVVPAGEVFDKFGYKKIYNDALMETVNQRISKYESNRLDITDYTIKGSVEYLKAMRGRGVKLYLASGTDRQDVIREAEVLGYADLFEGGIYGSVGDVSKYSKKMVIEEIINRHNLQGPELAVFGDGPVEIRECRKFDGIAIGIASDEIRRHGLNKEKRTRLIKAGAQIVVADFSEQNELMRLLFPAS
ncbi:MAG: HAD family hydrolase [Sedimentisphaerales bacterium]|nr:HAD family hydrolase [Sedimentisphaerales bacterium]